MIRITTGTPFLLAFFVIPILAGTKPKVSNFVIGDKKFVIFESVDVDDEKFKVDAEVAGNWDPEIGESIRYYKMIPAQLYIDSSLRINDTLDLCKKVQVQGTFDTTGSKRVYFQFLLDPKEKFKEWKEKWFWYKEDVQRYHVYFNVETLTINSTSFYYGQGKRLKSAPTSVEGKGKI